MLVFIALTASIVVSGCTQTGQVTGDSITGQATSDSQCRTVQEAYQAEVPYTETECEDVPYEAEETYLHYAEHDIVKQGFKQKWSPELGYYHHGTVTVMNTDDEAAWFAVEYNFISADREIPVTYGRQYIEPGETAEYEFTFDSRMKERVRSSFSVTSEPVEKTATVTKYREECTNVTRYRTETMYRDVEVCG